MSRDSLPAPDDQHKPRFWMIERYRRDEVESPGDEPWIPFGENYRFVYRLASETDAAESKPKPQQPVQAKQRRGLHTSRVRKYTVNRLCNQSLTLPQLQKRGFTHPENGDWVMCPRELKAILAHETKAVVQVILEVLDRTIGVPGDGPYGRGLWVELSTYDCAATGLMSRSAALRGFEAALSKGYLRRREIHDGKDNKLRYEYSLNWYGITE